MRYAVRFEGDTRKFCVIDELINNNIFDMHDTQTAASRQAQEENAKWEKYTAMLKSN
ncbi:MAG: hypothetical protein O3A84_13160 [Proteobacteria bacterium]|nr:hypothetical protein [Pseudomonadota bacterium]